MLEFKVSEIMNYIKDITSSDYILSNLVIEGEISNLTLHSNKNAYFSLKDEYSSIECLMYNYTDNENMKDSDDGDSILASGRINLNDKDGKLRLIVENIEPIGEGILYKRFIQTKNKLEAEGLFDPIYKKQIPKYPKKVGIVTSENGAAIKDIFSVMKRRNEFINVYLYSSLVQGPLAEDNIIKGIEYLDTLDYDLIIVGRGGGSFEDLDVFNSEKIARVIFNSKTPIISAVGHERDYVISDYVSDLRAATPTAAGEIVFFNHDEYIDKILNLIKYSHDLVESRINTYEKDLKNNKDNLSKMSLDKNIDSKIEKINQKINSANSMITHKIQLESERLNTINKSINKDIFLNKLYNNETFINKLIERANRNFENKLTIYEKEVFKLKSRLEKLDIKEMISKGYSIVLDKNDLPVKDINKINNDDLLNIIVDNGIIEVKVLNKRYKHELWRDA